MFSGPKLGLRTEGTITLFGKSRTLYLAKTYANRAFGKACPNTILNQIGFPKHAEQTSKRGQTGW